MLSHLHFLHPRRASPLRLSRLCFRNAYVGHLTGRLTSSSLALFSQTSGNPTLPPTSKFSTSHLEKRVVTPRPGDEKNFGAVVGKVMASGFKTHLVSSFFFLPCLPMFSSAFADWGYLRVVVECGIFPGRRFPGTRVAPQRGVGRLQLLPGLLHRTPPSSLPTLPLR